ncbi:hypothetical protein LOAG_11037 [Loa loa]|uniref:Uncharacterized protein n=1 Tax=Loa loa TaxID=7209 RepID=A0A1S0TNM8_LOALO|nr:hypothetical protein LOAG_11037 [Loa loa]EFO17463.1 hypothetical protein LOAG_11037 [Loa loa]
MEKFRLIIQGYLHCLDLTSSKNTRKAMTCATISITLKRNESKNGTLLRRNLLNELMKQFSFFSGLLQFEVLVLLLIMPQEAKIVTKTMV